VLRLDDLAPPTPRLPNRRFGLFEQLAASALLHAVVVAGIVATAMFASNAVVRPPAQTDRKPLAVPQIVFLSPTVPTQGGGGGGGGNRQPGRIRAAQAVGGDAITVRQRTRSAPTVSVTPAVAPAAEDQPPTSLLDVKPMAAGLFDEIGLPAVPSTGTMSLGPGTGGGVGTGEGTGVGMGRGAGLGEGAGGGMGGGIYRPGGAVTAPRLIEQVSPRYTPDALARNIQGTVVLEAVVTTGGTAAQIRVVRSLDRGDLDAEAVAAVARWRFEPGRLAGQPVAVLVTIMVDFWIR